ncbi:hypothetical protein [Agreia sp. COWG]|uniref:hypothetical protein n=1 Tax=Agreia sp. COWG TaxID=2773266 RepID=UPI001F3E17F8|nr:hypothetical protein [Agreia sp. COWG]
MHKGSDIPHDSPGMAIIQEAQTIVAYRQSRPEDAQWEMNFVHDLIPSRRFA